MSGVFRFSRSAERYETRYAETCENTAIGMAGAGQEIGDVKTM
jgi:hypothetical protein